MGAGHVKAVYAQWGHVKGDAFRLLTYVAVLMPDNQDRPRCELSRESLAVGLGYGSLDAPADRQVSRAIKSLIVAGAWSVARPASPGRRAHYWVNLSMERRTDSSTVSSKPVVRSLDRSVRSRRTISVATVDRSVHRDLGDTDCIRSGVVLQDCSQDTDGLTSPRTSREASPSSTRTKSVDTTHPTPSPLRLIVTDRPPSQPVATERGATQPSLWPAAVPDRREDTVTADEARDTIRAVLKGRSRTPITRAGRDRERIRQGQAVTPQPPPQQPTAGAPPASKLDGTGFCVQCYDNGRVVLASDPVAGSTCDTHTPVGVAS